MKQVITSLALIISFGMIQAQNSLQMDAAYASANEFEVNTAAEILNRNPVNDASTLSMDETSYEYSDLDENIEYLDEVQGPSTPNAIRKYQVMASLYDLTQSHIFDGRSEPFKMIFKTDKGTIVATYNWKGEVLTSEEKFRDVAVPNKVVRKALEDREDWKIVKTNYYVSYTQGRDATKIYTVQITNGKKRKKISLDVEGAIL
jgi:hypothetical protein